MRARHQAWVIARIVPKDEEYGVYRAIAGLHSERCDGPQPLEAVYHFMSLVKQPDNATIVEEELVALNGKYARGAIFNYRGGYLGEPAMPDVACPFIQFLFESAWAACGSEALSPNENFRHYYNNTGVTFINIDDPENPSHAFLYKLRTHYKNILLNGEGFMEHFTLECIENAEDPNYFSEDDYTRHKSAIDNLATFQVIGGKGLEEAWDADFGITYARLPHNKANTPRTDDKSPSLVDLLLEPAVEQAIKNNLTDMLDIFIGDPVKTSVIEEVICSQDPMSEVGLCLLQRIIVTQKRKTLDLSGLQLSGTQIVSLLCGHTEVVKVYVDVLNLSDNDQLTIHDLKRIIIAYPVLRRVVLYNNAVADSEILSLVDNQPELFRHLEAIIHPAFMPASRRLAISPAFTVLGIMRDVRGTSKQDISIPYFTPSQLAQGLADIFGTIKADKDFFQNYYSPKLTTPDMLSTESRLPGEPWEGRRVPFVPFVPTGIAQRWTLILLSDVGNDVAISNQTIPARLEKYAFIRPHKPVQEGTHEGEERPSKRIKITSNNRTDTLEQGSSSPHFDIYDIRSFFKELEVEGRPPTDPERVEGLFNLFDSICDQSSHNLQLMDHEFVQNVLERIK